MIGWEYHHQVAINYGIVKNHPKCLQIYARHYSMIMKHYCMMEYLKWIENVWMTMTLAWSLFYHQSLARNHIRFMRQFFAECLLGIHSFINGIIVGIVIWSRTSRMDFGEVQSNRTGQIAQGQSAIDGLRPSIAASFVCSEPPNSILDVLDHNTITTTMPLINECISNKHSAKMWCINMIWFIANDW